MPLMEDSVNGPALYKKNVRLGWLTDRINVVLRHIGNFRAIRDETKIRTKHRHLDNSFYYDDFVPFAHDPPGHTCGLPCCNRDLHIHLKVERSHGGCMSVPMHHDTPANNFTLQRGHLGLFKGQGQNRPAYKSGFYSVQPVKSDVPSRKNLHDFFGSVRGKTLPVTPEATSFGDQMHFLRGRNITLPNIARKDPAAFRRSNPFIIAGGHVGETADTDSLSSDSDLDYYMLSDFKSHVQVSQDNLEKVDNQDENSEKNKSLYPWKMLEDTQRERRKSTSQSEGSTYYDVIEDIKNSNYSWSSRDSKQLAELSRETKQPADDKRENTGRRGSTKYCTLNFDSSLFTPDRRHTLDTAMRYNPPKFDGNKKKHRKRRTKHAHAHHLKHRPQYDPKLSNSYKSRSLPPVLQNLNQTTVEEALSRLQKVDASPHKEPMPIPPTKSDKPKPPVPHKSREYCEKLKRFPPNLDSSVIEKTMSLPVSTVHENRGFVADDSEDKSIETLRRLVHDFKSQSLPPLFRPISYEAARIARSRLNSSETNIDDDVFGQENYTSNRLPTLDENPITLIL